MRTWVPTSVSVRVQVSYDRVQPAGSLIAGGVLAPGETPGWLDDEDLAVSDAVPTGHRFGAKVELVPDNRLKVVLHQPLLDERAFGERTPDFFRWIRHLAFDDDGANCGSGCGDHGSIFSSRFSSRSKRSRQKAPNTNGANPPSAPAHRVVLDSELSRPSRRCSTSLARFSTVRCLETAGCDTPA